MSTYLVALIMGNLTSVSAMVPHPDPGQADRKVSIYGTPDRSDARLCALVSLSDSNGLFTPHMAAMVCCVLWLWQ